MQTARALSRAACRIGPDSTRKIDTAIQVLGNRLATSSVLAALELPTRPGVVTPLMFEHQLVDDARAAGFRVVEVAGLAPGFKLFQSSSSSL